MGIVSGEALTALLVIGLRSHGSVIVTAPWRHSGGQPGPLGWVTSYVGRSVSVALPPSHETVTVTSSGVAPSRRTPPSGGSRGRLANLHRRALEV
jgi:hypothetical protein